MRICIGADEVRGVEIVKTVERFISSPVTQNTQGNKNWLYLTFDGVDGRPTRLLWGGLCKRQAKQVAKGQTELRVGLRGQQKVESWVVA